jgi:hypothetical protein
MFFALLKENQEKLNQEFILLKSVLAQLELLNIKNKSISNMLPSIKMTSQFICKYLENMVYYMLLPNSDSYSYMKLVLVNLSLKPEFHKTPFSAVPETLKPME